MFMLITYIGFDCVSLLQMLINMKKNILLFFDNFSKICCTNIDLWQDIRKFYSKLFEKHVLLKSERQNIAFNPLATLCMFETGQTIVLQYRFLKIKMVKVQYSR